MKLVKEYINEKFIEDSDPISDMGIGLNAMFKNLKAGDFVMITKDIPMTVFGKKRGAIHPKGSILYIHDVRKRHHGNIDVIHTQYKNVEDYHNDKPVRDEFGYLRKEHMWTWNYPFFKKYFMVIDPKYLKESINEKFEEDSDPIKDMGIGIPKGVVELRKTFPMNDGNSHYRSLVKQMNKKQCFIGVKIDNETMMKIYEQLQDIIVPFFQSDHTYGASGKYDSNEYVQIVTHICSYGRYDMNITNMWDLNPEEKEFAKSLYKGRNNKEYPFFMITSGNKWRLAFIISISGKLVTLVIEGDPPTPLKKYFKKPAKYFDSYLGEWKKPDEIVALVRKFYELTK